MPCFKTIYEIATGGYRFTSNRVMVNVQELRNGRYKTIKRVSLDDFTLWLISDNNEQTLIKVSDHAER